MRFLAFILIGTACIAGFPGGAAAETLASPATFLDATSDGRSVIFQTAVTLDPADDDQAADLYVWTEGAEASTLITVGPQGEVARFAAASDDLSVVVFETPRGLVLADADGALDVYERRSDGSVRLVSDGSSPAHFAFFNQQTGRVGFETDAVLVDGDSNQGSDLYLRHPDGALALVSGGTPLAPGNRDGVVPAGISTDGSRIWFETDVPLVAEDFDTGWDLYERGQGGSLRLISGARGGLDDGSHLVSATAGGDVYFETAQRLVDADRDGGTDVYRREPNGILTLVSPGRGEKDASFVRVGGADEVLISTGERLSPQDIDGSVDVYAVSPLQRPRLVTPGVAHIPSRVRALLGDGTAIVATSESLIAADVDPSSGLYAVEPSGAIRMIADSGSFVGITARDSVVFQTRAQVVAGDADALVDAYERRTDGSLWLLTTETPDVGVRVAALTPSGAVVYETVGAGAGRIGVQVARPVESSITGRPAIGQRLFCGGRAAPGTIAARQWLRDGVPTGQIDRSYRVRRGDLGRALSCQIVRRDGQVLETAPLVVPAACLVPDVRGLRVPHAKARIGWAGCVPGEGFEYASPHPRRWRRVGSTSPAAGVLVPSGTIVSAGRRR